MTYAHVFIDGAMTTYTYNDIDAANAEDKHVNAARRDLTFAPAHARNERGGVPVVSYIYYFVSG